MEPTWLGCGETDFPRGHWMLPRFTALSLPIQETMMDHPLRTISYIADIGNIVVLMARRRMPRSNSQENVEASHPSQDGKRQYKMICHVFESEDVRVLPPSPSRDLNCLWGRGQILYFSGPDHMCKHIEYLLCGTQPSTPILALGTEGWVKQTWYS